MKYLQWRISLLSYPSHQISLQFPAEWKQVRNFWQLGRLGWFLACLAVEMWYYSVFRRTIPQNFEEYVVTSPWWKYMYVVSTEFFFFFSLSANTVDSCWRSYNIFFKILRYTSSESTVDTDHNEIYDIIGYLIKLWIIWTTSQLKKKILVHLTTRLTYHST